MKEVPLATVYPPLRQRSEGAEITLCSCGQVVLMRLSMAPPSRSRSEVVRATFRQMSVAKASLTKEIAQVISVKSMRLDSFFEVSVPCCK